MDNHRNFLLAAVLSLGVVFLWQIFFIQPRIDRERAVAEQQQAAGNETSQAPAASGEGSAVPSPGGGAATTVPGAEPAPKAETDAPRLALKSDKLEGSINLRGARIDDLRLVDYRETIDKTSPNIQLLEPSGKPNAYFAEFGWQAGDAAGAVPGPKTEWTRVSGDTLAPGSPVTLEFSGDKGLTFRRTIELDTDYMFLIKDTVTNTSTQTLALQPYGRVARFGQPETEGIFVLHEGFVGTIGEDGTDEIDYDDIEDESGNAIVKPRAPQGWLGITDKYWATALVPGTPFVGGYRRLTGSRPSYQTDFLGDEISIPAGGEATVTNRLFAGAKKVDIVDRYETSLDIRLFSNLIDWGWFPFLTKPLFMVMNWFYQLIGNFGVAILLVTVAIKAVFFPLANMSYKSMANMKKMQPEMTAIRERFADDRQAQQKAMMDLYKKEKINPAAGCWPILVQIPVFFALYKVIYVTIEMRHAPFFGWIQDLSAPDPTSIFNLFGLLPFEVPGLLLVGVWPLLMGITMFVQMQMNPAPPDPTQQLIFKWMPVLFTFMLATFPAGLVIYWAWNNFLSIIQQGVIMRRQGAKIELWDNLKGLFGRKEKEAG